MGQTEGKKCNHYLQEFLMLLGSSLSWSSVRLPLFGLATNSEAEPIRVVYLSDAFLLYHQIVLFSISPKLLFMELLCLYKKHLC
jgi:hypothetical protein